MGFPAVRKSLSNFVIIEKIGLRPFEIGKLQVEKVVM
jgi:hypothetical protein